MKEFVIKYFDGEKTNNEIIIAETNRTAVQLFWGRVLNKQIKFQCLQSIMPRRKISK